jgi:hypothetical protein
VSKDAKTRVYRNGGSFVDGRYDDERERDGIGANLSTRALVGGRSTDHQELLLGRPKTPRRECRERERALWMQDVSLRQQDDDDCSRKGNKGRKKKTEEEEEHNTTLRVWLFLAGPLEVGHG